MILNYTLFLNYVHRLVPWLSICGPRTDVRTDQNLENKIKHLKVLGVYRYLRCSSVSVESHHHVLQVFNVSGRRRTALATKGNLLLG